MNLNTPLKQIILSLEKDANVLLFDQYFKTLSQIEQTHPAHPALISIIKMMRSLGSYLQTNTENPHPDTFKVLTTIAERAQKLTHIKDLNKQQVTLFFQESHTDFKSLKDKIANCPVFSDAQMNELRSAFLAIDWEITDATLNNLEQVTNTFLSRLKSKSVLATYLKMMQSTVRYIKTQKAKVHTQTISLLKALVSSFEQIVQSPGMDQNKKKQLLNSDIHRFKAFKQTISAKKISITPPVVEDDDMMPALSHVTSSLAQDAHQNYEFTALPDVRETLTATSIDQFEDITPALTGKKVPTIPAGNIMDDLFNAKETPADELLDAIHLMDIHGNEEHALKMLDRDDELQARGIQSFCPKRLDTDPIPEIGNRLDEFFNLEEPELSPQEISLPQAEHFQPSESETLPTDPGIIPFEYEDEALDSAQQAELLEDKSSDGVSGTRKDAQRFCPDVFDDANLKTLQSFLVKPGWEADRWSLQSIQKECFNLKDLWPDDKQKNGLLDIILSLSRSLEDLTSQDDLDKKALGPYKKESKGFFGTIKAIFTS
ncbi:MAG: hypothetical protein ABIJ31_00935 [Pseudomonadota bacterium]